MTPQQEAWLALTLVEGVGPRTIARLLEGFGDVESVLAALPEDLARSCGLRSELAQRIAACRHSGACLAEAKLVAEQGVQLLVRDEPGYPGRLADLSLAPALLYVKGSAPLPSGPALAVVGTRRPSRYGEKVTRMLVAEVAAALPDAVIVSGLALGVDAAAHDEALRRGLQTVAVLGSGLGSIYPRAHTELAERVAQQGALLSEFPISRRPHARNFPIRNRIISALADAVLVVEAGERSGALITAGFAQNQGRKLLAVPGQIDHVEAKGANHLIATGQATLVRDGADVLAALRTARNPAAVQLDWLAPQSEPPAPAVLQKGDKGRILTCLQRGPAHPDDLCREMELPVERLLGLLLELELSGEIVQTTDHHYQLA